MNNIFELIQQIQLRLNPDKKASIIKEMQEQIDWLINNDFSQLVHILYRLDVDENKLRSLIQHRQTTDASVLIANLIIERQLKKAEVRNQTKADIDTSGDERW